MFYFVVRINIEDPASQTTSQTPRLAFDLDYEKGTIGFREYREETALFKNIQIELLEPILYF